MENSRILNWRRWSLVRRAQVIVTALIAFVTIAMVAYDAIGIMHWEQGHRLGRPQSGRSYIVLDAFFLLMIPADRLAHAAGIQESLGYWGWRLLAIALNTTVAFGLGTLIGWLAVAGKTAHKRFTRGGDDK
jgi:hypothetical protein